MNTVPRILLIEDNRADVYLIEQGLRARGLEFELVHLANGDEALHHCCPGRGMPLDPPALILLDLHLPGTEGDEILRAIRGEPRLKAVPVAVISGADQQRLRRTDLTGSSLVIHKSMDLEEYMSAVGDAVLQLLSPHEWIWPQTRTAPPATGGSSTERERRSKGGRAKERGQGGSLGTR